MKILALETTAKAASCAVLEDGRPIATAWQATGLTHSRTLLPMVEDMLRNSEMTLEQMDALTVAVGPGSFTGLRIGISALKGLAWGAGKPCIPVSTLEAMAWPLQHMEGTILCAMDARRQQVYTAAFTGQGDNLMRLRPDRAISLEEVAGDLEDLPRPITVVGDGAELCHSFLMERGIHCRLAPRHLRLQSALGVAMAAEAMGPDAQCTAQELTPVYLRLSQAERERLAREKAAEEHT